MGSVFQAPRSNYEDYLPLIEIVGLPLGMV